jgi:hypothetical protein
MNEFSIHQPNRNKGRPRRKPPEIALEHLEALLHTPCLNVVSMAERPVIAAIIDRIKAGGMCDDN